MDGITGLDGDEFEQAPGDGEGQGNLVCCHQWGRKEDTTEQLNNNKIYIKIPWELSFTFFVFFFFWLFKYY